MAAVDDAVTLETTLLLARDQVNTVLGEVLEGPANNAYAAQTHIHRALKDVADVIVGLGGAPSVND